MSHDRKFVFDPHQGPEDHQRRLEALEDEIRRLAATVKYLAAAVRRAAK